MINVGIFMNIEKFFQCLKLGFAVTKLLLMAILWKFPVRTYYSFPELLFCHNVNENLGEKTATSEV